MPPTIASLEKWDAFSTLLLFFDRLHDSAINISGKKYVPRVFVWGPLISTLGTRGFFARWRRGASSGLRPTAEDTSGETARLETKVSVKT